MKRQHLSLVNKSDAKGKHVEGDKTGHWCKRSLTPKSWLICSTQKANWDARSLNTDTQKDNRCLWAAANRFPLLGNGGRDQTFKKKKKSEKKRQRRAAWAERNGRGGGKEGVVSVAACVSGKTTRGWLQKAEAGSRSERLRQRAKSLNKTASLLSISPSTCDLLLSVFLLSFCWCVRVCVRTHARQLAKTSVA